MRIVFGVLTAWLVSSCTFFGNEERLGRLEEGSTQKIEIPEGLDRPQFVDLMPIPEIEDPRGLAGTKFELRPARAAQYKVRGGSDRHQAIRR